jgi:murein DD-endopeptidase MepM/ murein hydrolase activator NlpD
VDFNHYPDDNGWMVYASAPGTVSRVANLGNTSYGRYIIIDHSGGWQTLYAHLSAQNVSVGQAVTEKTMIGRVGNTGGSTGPHLHYEQKLNNSAQRATFRDGNPVYWGSRNLARTTSCP